jgi:hypothetical protein
MTAASSPAASLGLERRPRQSAAHTPPITAAGAALQPPGCSCPGSLAYKPRRLPRCAALPTMVLTPWCPAPRHPPCRGWCRPPSPREGTAAGPARGMAGSERRVRQALALGRCSCRQAASRQRLQAAGGSVALPSLALCRATHPLPLAGLVHGEGGVHGGAQEGQAAEKPPEGLGLRRERTRACCFGGPGLVRPRVGGGPGLVGAAELRLVGHARAAREAGALTGEMNVGSPTKSSVGWECSWPSSHHISSQRGSCGPGKAR